MDDIRDPDDLTSLTREEAIAPLQSLEALISDYWNDKDLRQRVTVQGKTLMQIVSGTCAEFPTLPPTEDRFNHMHLALTSIVAKTEGLEAMMNVAGLSYVWGHRARSIQAVAKHAIDGLPEPIFPEGPPTASTDSPL